MKHLLPKFQLSKLLFIFIALFLFAGILNAKEKTSIDSLKVVINTLSKKVTKQAIIIDSLKSKNTSSTITLDVKDWEKKKAIFDKSEGWFSKNAAALIGILALVISLITTYMQIKGAKKNELVKFKRESNEKQKELLKELVAQFIKKSIKLNKKLDKILYDTRENQGAEIANSEFSSTEKVRDELEDLYYSILVSLDNSTEHQNLNTALNAYMSYVIWVYEVDNLESEKYTNQIRAIYPIIKSIVYPN